MGGLQKSSDRANETHKEQRALIDRILASSLFEKSPRLSDFLKYIVDRALSGHPEEVHEQFIGHHVFGRPIDYNYADDTIVRVSARQLRAKVREYFHTCGHEERWLVEIPKGGYLPVFRKRKLQAPAVIPVRPGARTHQSPLLPKWSVVLIITSAVVLLVLGVWGWKQPKLGTPPDSQTAPPIPITDIFAGSKQPVQVVLSDSALVIMQSLAGHPFSLAQYASHNYRKIPEKLAHQPHMRGLWALLGRAQSSNVGDEETSSRFLASISAHGPSVVIRAACNMTTRDFMSGNSILLGSWYSDPWTQLFTKGLNFQIGSAPRAAAAAILNLKPSKGEKRAYSFENMGKWTDVGYARVALVPNLTNTGRVLLIAGLDMQSTEAAGDFLLNPSSTQKLKHIIGSDKNGRFPNFELLLRTSRLVHTPNAARIVAFRVYSNNPNQ